MIFRTRVDGSFDHLVSTAKLTGRNLDGGPSAVKRKLRCAAGVLWVNALDGTMSLPSGYFASASPGFRFKFGSSGDVGTRMSASRRVGSVAA
jgi:hypothetical protein